MIAAGTLKQVRLSLDIPPAAFQSMEEKPSRLLNMLQDEKMRSTNQRRASDGTGDEWGDGGIDDQEFASAAERDAGFIDIDDIGCDNGSTVNRPFSNQQKDLEEASEEASEEEQSSEAVV